MDARSLLLAFGGGFFLVGLLSGVWKFAHIHRSPKAEAPVYVDITHRASLMYAFSTLLIDRFVVVSRLPDTVEVAAVLAQVIFFALAIGTYIIHGLLDDTDNQLARPHRLGRAELPAFAVPTFMALLIAGEVGGFCVLLYGALVA